MESGKRGKRKALIFVVLFAILAFVSVGCASAATISDDINGDGIADLFISSSYTINSTSYSVLAAVSGSNGHEIWNATFVNKSVWIPSWVTQVDLTGDGKKDVLLCIYDYPNSSIAVYDGVTGSEVWSVLSEGEPSIISDIDGDGLSDVWVWEWTYSYTVSALKGTNGVLLWNKTVEGWPQLISDVNGNGVEDFLVSCSNYTTHITAMTVFEGATGAQIWGMTSDYYAWAYQVGDLNGDGLDDIIVSNSTTITAYQGTNGAYLWSKISPSVTPIDDVNGNGKDDLFTVLGGYGSATSFNLVMLDGGDGQPIYNQSFTKTADESVSGQAIFDITGDGKKDIIFEKSYYNYTTDESTTTLIAIRSTDGTQVWSSDFDVSLYSAEWHLTASHDLNGDGRHDLLYTSCNWTTNTDTIWAISGMNGATIWIKTIVSEMPCHSDVSARYDLDADSLKDVIVSKWMPEPGMTIALKGTDGVELWNYSVEMPTPPENQPPVANFTFNPANPVVNETVTFNASDSYDPDGTIANYEWEFGDGDTGTGEVTTHAYSSPGDYTVNLTVTDDDGTTNTTSKVVTVHPKVRFFDTGPGTYPSISGTHIGTIIPDQDITVRKIYTYPCTGTGGHTEYVRIWNNSWDVTATWNGYAEDWHNITFDSPFVLEAGKTYSYEIRTGSYPQIIHATNKTVTGGIITCTSFVDANGKEYTDWIPAIRLE